MGRTVGINRCQKPRYAASPACKSSKLFGHLHCKIFPDGIDELLGIELFGIRKLCNGLEVSGHFPGFDGAKRSLLKFVRKRDKVRAKIVATGFVLVFSPFRYL